MSSVSTSNTIQVTIPGPQVLGWFLELTPFVEQLRRYQDPSTPEAVTDDEPAGRHAL